MKIGKKLHPLERKVLPFLKKSNTDRDLVKKTGMKEVEVVRALQWLSNKDILKLKKKEVEIIHLDKNGKIYSEKGLPEKRFLKALEKEEELEFNELKAKSGLDKQELNISIGQLKQEGLIDMRKEEGELFISITDTGKKNLFENTNEENILSSDFPLSMDKLSKEQKVAVENLKKRKNIIEIKKSKTLKYELTSDGEKLLEEGISDKEYIEKLTPEMLKKKSWKKKEFREYDVSINVPRKNYGKKHFVNEAIEYVKDIWTDMGFQEMEGDVVQTAFWDMDSLFIPQDHPAREMQDTFYLKDPKNRKIVDQETYDKVKRTHESGWDTRSKAWGYKFDRQTAERLLLRTHTTVLSAKTISNLKKSDLPAKFFSVGKVYRNESLDWKHLFEFYQVEGIVVDPDANFRDLIGYLKRFFSKMGFEDVRIRPAYFPYTEPSAEVDVYDPKKKRWIELGGAGIFRPEVTKPLMGFECPVLAWGLGLERIITDYYDIKDLREIYKNDLEQLRKMRKFIR